MRSGLDLVTSHNSFLCLSDAFWCSILLQLRWHQTLIPCDGNLSFLDLLWVFLKEIFDERFLCDVPLLATCLLILHLGHFHAQKSDGLLSNDIWFAGLPLLTNGLNDCCRHFLFCCYKDVVNICHEKSSQRRCHSFFFGRFLNPPQVWL